MRHALFGGRKESVDPLEGSLNNAYLVGNASAPCPFALEHKRALPDCPQPAASSSRPTVRGRTFCAGACADILRRDERADTGPRALQKGIRVTAPTTSNEPRQARGGHHDRAQHGKRLRVGDVVRRVTQPRNWRVGGKLAAAVLVPTVLAAALVINTLSGSISEADDYSNLAALTRLQRQALGLVHELQTERDLTAHVIASRRKTRIQGMDSQRTSVDRATGEYTKAAAQIDRDYSNALRARLSTVAREIDSLAALRYTVQAASLTQGSILAQYTAIIDSLLDLGAGLVTLPGGPDLASDIRSVDLLARATEYTSQERAVLVSALTTGTFLVGRFPEFTGLVARRQASVEEFAASASDAHRTLYADTIKGPAVTRTKQIQDHAIELAVAPRLGLDPDDWWQASTQKINLMQSAELRVLDDLTAHADRLHAESQREALLANLELLVMFVVAAGVSLTVIRSMTRPLRRLRMSSLHVADHLLPDIIGRLRRAELDDLSDLQAVPTSVQSRDEIGEVAHAFDAVQKAVLRLATDQAALRGSINAMFIHMARRSQALVRQLLHQINALEQTERSPEGLTRLFALDHLATRMLRTSESLLVLAGSDNGRTRKQPAPLIEILRAASSEVEHYPRIAFGGVPDAVIANHAVFDVIHLLAELMENATVFSPPYTEAVVSCRTFPDKSAGLIIEIRDSGIGMTPEALRTANQRLNLPPTIDPRAVRTMGLFVVGQLARRHGIQVRLTQRSDGGLTATVVLPSSLVILRDATRSWRVIPHRPTPRSGAQSQPGQLNAQPEKPDALTQPEAVGAHSTEMAADSAESGTAIESVFTSAEDRRRHRRLAEDMTVQEFDTR